MPPPRPVPPARSSDSALDCFVVAAPGLESLVARELHALGITGTVEPGGVKWSGTVEHVARANLWLRTASRVLVRAASFRARTFFELERHARRIPWERFVRPSDPVRFRVTSRKSKLYHTEAIAERLGKAVARALGATANVDTLHDDEAADETSETDAPDTQLFIVRALRDELVVSADSSGAHLHKRGYRKEVAKAPLRETLAAAMLLGSGFTEEMSLVDPMCGSGTIPIEAAMISRRMAPGLQRSFAFQRWPTNDEAAWKRELASARERVLPKAALPIVGTDRDAGAIEGAKRNAERAGVLADLTLDVASLSAAQPPGEGAGLLVTNPPYGVRVGDPGPLRDLYARLGDLARGPFAGWTLAVLSPGDALEGQMRLSFEERFQTTNGGIPVHLIVAERT